MSPIHDQSYRHYTGEKRPLGRAWSVITWTGIRALLARKWFLGLLVFAWLPFIVRTVQIYVVTVYPAAGQIVAVDVRMFLQFMEQQDTAVFLVTIFAGAGLIANDRRANALQIYLSKPLLRMEYIGGKLAILTAFLLFITLLPGLLLIVMQVLFAGSLEFLSANLHVIPAVVLSSLVRVLVSACTMLALSSLSKSTRYVAILYAGAIFFTSAVFGVLTVVTGSTRVAWVSVGANLANLTDVIFRQPPRYETPVIVSVLVLAGLLAVSVSVLERRVRGVEVVA
jgi:ABC-type transport system involved in multi-copper enzyme maturation permease subunit